MKPFRDSTDLVGDGERLRARAEEDGYLFIRGLLPVDSLERVRLEFLDVLLDEGYADAEGYRDQLVNPAGIPEGRGSIPNDTYARLYLLESFHALQLEPALLGVMEDLLDPPVLAHPSIISRVMFPQRENFTTPAHQDFPHVQGSADVYTAWFPLHDLPASMGGLAVAAGSHRRGVYDYRPALGAGGIAVIDPLEGTWATNEFHQGDVVIFHSLTVHQGLPNTSNRFRISVDGRYQCAREPVLQRTLLPHMGVTTWEAVYAGWRSDDLKYYWSDLETTIAKVNDVHLEQVDALTLKEFEDGTLPPELVKKSLGAMERIIERDGPELRERAEAVLAAHAESDDA